ncbi:MFS transporter [Streptacidiphilus sp. PAMC 29251]
MHSPAPRPPRSVLVLLSLAPLLANADAGLVVLALPDIRQDLSMGLAGAHWVINVYVLLVGGLQLLGGRLCDRAGARRLFLWSLAAFAAASAGCGLAPSGPVLLLARAGQAMAVAVLVPAAMCILLVAVPGSAERRRALALWAACGGIGSIVGVLAGGLAVTVLDWRWAFLLNVPLALAGVVVGWRLCPDDTTRPRDATLDVPGALLLVGSLGGLVYGLVGTAGHGTGPHTWAVLGIAAALGGLLWWRQTHVVEPLLPTALLRDRSLVAGAVGIGLIAAATSPVVFVCSMYLQQVHGYSACLTGCALLPVVGGVILVGRWATRLLGRLGPRLPCLVGCALTGSGLLLLTRLQPDSPYLSGLLPGLTLVGAGLPFLWMACELAAVSGVSRLDTGAAAGVVQCAGQIGAALGLALAVTVCGTAGPAATSGPVDPAALTVGATRAFWACAGLILCAALTARFGLRAVRPVRSEPVQSEPVRAGYAPSSSGRASDQPESPVLLVRG